LIEPAPSVGEVYAAAGRAHGLTISAAALDDAFRWAWPQWTQPGRGGPMSAIADADATWRWWRGLVMWVLEDVGFSGDREAVFEACYAAFAAPNAWRLYSDVTPTLDAFARSGHRLGVLSNWDHRLPPLLDALSLSKYFEHQIVSALERVEKPDPRIFELAVQRAGVPADEIMYVGDHVHIDLEPARAVGIQAYLIDRAGRYTGRYVISSLMALVELAKAP
jgi:putative hydrolase of the HAD superfamily